MYDSDGSKQKPKPLPASAFGTAEQPDPKVIQDKVVKIKLTEAIKSIDKFCGVGKAKLVKDNVVVQTMRYMELLKELKKSGNKNKKTL